MINMLVFIDESGDHNLSSAHFDNLYNAFVLAAVCFRNVADYKEFDEEFRNLKRELFTSDDFIIHTSEITRPNRASDQRNLKFNDRDFRSKFYKAMNELISSSKFFIIPRVIDKQSFALRYSHLESKPDPYNFSFDYVLNRIFFETNSITKIEIYPEERNHTENRKLKTLFEQIKLNGTRFIKAKEIQRKIYKFELVSKLNNDSGLQLADLVVSPIGRHFIGKNPRESDEILYSVIEKKLRNGKYEIFP
jgi:hypothetical protein